MGDYKLSRPEASASGAAVYTPPPRPPPPLLHHPAPYFWTSLRTPGSEVQDDAGGGRVWVPSIPLGWVGAGFSPTASTPRAWVLSRRRRHVGGRNPYIPKMGA